MSILLHNEIKEAIEKNDIYMHPKVMEHISVNSVDVTLSNQLKIYTTEILDMKSRNSTRTIEIPEEGYILQPGELYLGMTNEAIGSDVYVPMYEGRSSMARLGIQSHISAGFGDLGFMSNWTLEITVVKPVKIYPNIRIGQVYFHKPELGSYVNKFYHGKYTNQKNPQESKSYLDFKGNK